jgi:hypothetical protein
MGNGFAPILVNTALTSLNAIFSTDLAATKAKYNALNSIYPSFLVYTNDMSDRHIWRKRTLRHAGWLLTSECDFNSQTAKYPYPGKNFLKWLRWLTWLQVMPPSATISVDGVIKNLAPAEAIMTTLRTALEDPQSTSVTFDWNEGAVLAVTITSVSPNYSVSVTSVKEADIPGGVNDDDEDNVPSS